MPSSPERFRSKRAFDLAVIVVLAVPLVLVAGLVAVWIRMTSRGPVLFRQERVGYRQNAIVIYKFRTMRAGAETDSHRIHVRDLVQSGRPMTKLDSTGDRRLMRGGRLLRNTGLDELPQLVNVLRGELSLVGPRPCLPEELEFFSSAQRERFQTLPGLTGYWQVKGKNRTTFDEMAALDVAYVRKRSLRLDSAILLQTPGALARQLLDARAKAATSHHPPHTAGPSAGESPHRSSA